MKRIVAHYDPPPIPYRNHDWVAYYDDLGADSSPYGYGSTKEEAIKDLKENQDG